MDKFSDKIVKINCVGSETRALSDLIPFQDKIKDLSSKNFELFKNHTKTRDIVYDPFVGSGTAIIACEKLNRRCFAMDLDPQYCQMAIERFEKLTNKKHEKIQ